MEDDLLFRNAEEDYLRGRALSAPELVRMERALSSANRREVCIACGSILRDRASGLELKEKARAVLRELCESASVGSGRTELSITLLLVPVQEMQSDSVRRFVYDLFQAERFTLRANAVTLLGGSPCRGTPSPLLYSI